MIGYREITEMNRNSVKKQKRLKMKLEEMRQVFTKLISTGIV